YAEAHETLTTALDRVHDPLVGARLHRLLGEVLVRRDEFDAAADTYAAGEKLLGAPVNGDASWWREWLDVKLYQATLHYWKADSAKLHAAADALRPHVDEHGTPRQRASFIGTQVFDLLRRDRYAASAETAEPERGSRGANATSTRPKGQAPQPLRIGLRRSVPARPCSSGARAFHCLPSMSNGIASSPLPSTLAPCSTNVSKRSSRTCGRRSKTPPARARAKRSCARSTSHAGMATPRRTSAPAAPYASPLSPRTPESQAGSTPARRG